MKRIASFNAQKSLENHAGTEGPPPADAARAPCSTRLLRIAGSWLGFTGLYAATGGTCPFCGQPTCPTGFLSAGIVGGVLAFGLQAWRRFQK